MKTYSKLCGIIHSIHHLRSSLRCKERENARARANIEDYLALEIRRVGEDRLLVGASAHQILQHILLVAQHAVVLREGETAEEGEIREFVSGRVADFKVPRRVLVLDEIPKGATGKLQRIGLAEKLGLG